ncbi:hypothetical protein EH223_14625 [candidate division KSB1 bacterium]|nr:CpsD/CapB family tyrosine-protein kinase [candidate division KSB1 bacterium]RQW01550.1 MAG: hypothetical protein EH223_14625 [candidate division KSB1 bacterium]
MSFVHDMLTAAEKHEHGDYRPKSVHPKPGLFVLDMPNEIVSDFYDLKEHVRIANKQGFLNTLAIADTSPGEGSSTIATFLAFLMSSGVLTHWQQQQGKQPQNETAQKLYEIPESDRIVQSGVAHNMHRVSTRDVFQDWEKSIDSRFAFAKNSNNILLVDANLHHPAIHRYFALEAKGGLAEVIESGQAWQQLTRPVRDSHLHILTAGQTRLNPIELLGSERFRGLVREWKQLFRYVIFDSPAVLNFADSISLASTVDGVVLVVKAGQTRWDNAQKAKRKLIAAQANLLGVTLNRRKMTIPDGLYKRLIK